MDCTCSWRRKGKKVLSTLSSFGHPLKQPLKTLVKSPMLGLFSEQSLCVWGKEGKETEGVCIYGEKSKRQKNQSIRFTIPINNLELS